MGGGCDIKGNSMAKKKKLAKKKVGKKKVLKKKTVRRKVAEKKKSDKHPIASAIDKFLHRVWGIQYSAITFIPKVLDVHHENIKKMRAKLVETRKLLYNKDISVRKVGLKEVWNVYPKARRLIDSNIIEITVNGYFLSLFSAFDAYTGNLLSSIYLKKPALFNRLERSMTVSEMLQYDSLNNIKLIILQKEIESFRRDSYIEQFKDLESKFDIKLKLFKRWPEFVECTQRRNIFGHCDGIVSDQYLKICKKEGYLCPESLKVGDKLEISPNYLFKACELMMEVGLKLGQTLWRKVLPEELKEADRHLNKVIFDLLKREKWDIAQLFSEFAVNLPRYSDDISKRIFVINYAIALKFGRKPKEAEKVLSKMDWSATLNDFKIAEAVLREDYDKAAIIMKRIGKGGELIHEYAYHDWPLFRKFRENELFFKAYESVYGHSFADESQRIAETLKAQTEKELRRKKRKLKKFLLPKKRRKKERKNSLSATDDLSQPCSHLLFTTDYLL